MAANEGLRPWPRLRDTWWVFGLAVGALGIFVLGFLVALRCGPRGCHGMLGTRLLDLEAIGGVPRLFTTALFLGSGVLAWRASRSARGRTATWWTAVAAIAVVLALAKVTSWHSVLKNSVSAGGTLVGGLVLTALTLGALWVTGHRWGVTATRSVVLALTVYAAVALGLDLLTGAATAVQERVGWLTVSSATFVEELGEALSALLLLVTVRWQASRRAVVEPAVDQLT